MINAEIWDHFSETRIFKIPNFENKIINFFFLKKGRRGYRTSKVRRNSKDKQDREVNFLSPEMSKLKLT